MKFTVLDIYPKNKNYRISKDQNGSYGTGNDYGDNIFSKFLKFFVSKNVDCPPLYAAQICGELKSKGHLVKYTQSIQDIDSDSIIILISSIVCHEHEIECLNLIKNQNIKIFAVGPFASNFPQKYVESVHPSPVVNISSQSLFSWCLNTTLRKNILNLPLLK